MTNIYSIYVIYSVYSVYIFYVTRDASKNPRIVERSPGDGVPGWLPAKYRGGIELPGLNKHLSSSHVVRVIESVKTNLWRLKQFQIFISFD